MALVGSSGGGGAQPPPSGPPIMAKGGGDGSEEEGEADDGEEVNPLSQLGARSTGQKRKARAAKARAYLHSCIDGLIPHLFLLCL